MRSGLSARITLDVVISAIDGRRAVVRVLALIALLAGAWVVVLLFVLSLLTLARRADDAADSWERPLRG